MNFRTLFVWIFTIAISSSLAQQEAKKQPVSRGFFNYLFASKKMPVVENDKLTNACKECHWVQLPGLLPAKSWEALMNGLDNHFGEKVTLDDALRKELADYLKSNAADFIESKVSMTIMKSAGEGAPMAISQLDGIKAIHEDLPETVWSHPEIKSRANCTACHQDVDKTGMFDEETIKMPEDLKRGHH